MEKEIDVEFRGHEFFVTYAMEGEDRPATRDDPAEFRYPDIYHIQFSFLTKKEKTINTIAGKEIISPWKNFSKIEERIKNISPKSEFLKELYEEIEAMCESDEECNTIGEEYDEGDKEKYYT